MMACMSSLDVLLPVASSFFLLPVAPFWYFRVQSLARRTWTCRTNTRPAASVGRAPYITATYSSPCIYFVAMSFALYSLLVVGYKSQVDLLLLLLVAFDVLVPTATKIPLVSTSVVSVSLCM